MNKVSKKLNKVIIVEGKKGELLNFISKVQDKNISLVSVSFPKNVEKLSTSYINSNWRTSKNSLEKVAFFAKCENNKYMFACSTEKDASEILKVVKELFLDAEYSYVQDEEDQKSVIVKKTFKNGVFDKKESSARFNSNKYSVAKIFA